MKLATKDKSYFENALEYHNKHKQIADIGGKFIAHINLGIVYSNLNESEKAAINFQMALRCAIQMSSKAGQLLAIGNLGKVGYNNTVISDHEKLQMLIKRYIELSNYMRDDEGKSNAYLELGKVMMQKKDWLSSARHLDEARTMAKLTNNKEVLNDASVNYGIAQANMAWEDYSKKVMQSKN